MYGAWVRNVVADAGYESLENYLFLDEYNLINKLQAKRMIGQTGVVEYNKAS